MHAWLYIQGLENVFCVSLGDQGLRWYEYSSQIVVLGMNRPCCSLEQKKTDKFLHGLR
jgi:hypothetical protein